MLHGISMEFMECLNNIAKKKDTFYTMGGRAVQMATGSNLLDTKYKFYGFNEYLRETIN